MKTNIALAVMALAVVCLSLAPSMAAGRDSNNKDGFNDSFQKGSIIGPHDWMLLVDDATRGNFDNMTMNQIKELRDEKTAQLNNMTLNQIDELHQKQQEKLNNMTLAQIREMKKDQMGGNGPRMMDQGMDGQAQKGSGMDKGPAGNGRAIRGQPH